MSKLGQLKRKVNYETSVPRCATCIKFKEASIRLSTNSQTYRKHAHCKEHYFTISPNGVCDDWKSNKGEVLDNETKEPKTK